MRRLPQLPHTHTHTCANVRAFTHAHTHTTTTTTTTSSRRCPPPPRYTHARLYSGAIEPQFYALLVKGLGLEGADLPAQNDQASWPAMKALFARTIAAHPRDHWARVFAGSDACVSPVLTREEYLVHPHTLARRNVIPRVGAEGTCPA